MKALLRPLGSATRNVVAGRAKLCRGASVAIPDRYDCIIYVYLIYKCTMDVI